MQVVTENVSQWARGACRQVYLHLVLGLLQLAVYLVSWCRLVWQDVCYGYVSSWWPQSQHEALRIPQHMGMVLPAPRDAYQAVSSAVTCILAALQLGTGEDARHLAPKSAACIQQLSVYDRHGCLAQHVREVMLAVEGALRQLPPQRPIHFHLGGRRIASGMLNLWGEGQSEDEEDDEEDTGDDGTLVNESRPGSPHARNPGMTPLLLNILHEVDGKETMLRVLACDPAVLDPAAPMDAAAASATLAREASSCAPLGQVPEVVVVFEGYATRCMLHAYPPWDLAQAELFFIPGDGSPRPWHVRQVCEQFARTQQRHGK